MMQKFIIIDLNSGLMDGVYFDRDYAVSVYESFKAEQPGKWILVEVIHHPEHFGIPDNLFWGMNHLSKYRASIQEPE